MKGLMQQEKGIPILEEIDRGLLTQPNAYNPQWQNHRYEYYCGDWRCEWHKGRDVEYRNGKVTTFTQRVWGPQNQYSRS